MSQRGSIRKRGTTWTAYWRVDTPAGERQHSKGGFATKLEANKFLNGTVQSLEVGEYAEPNKMTLDDYLVQRWMPLRAMSLRPSTLNMYEVNILVHVAPSLGRVKIQQLTPDHLDRYYAKLVGRGLSAKTVRNIHVMLHKALKDAVRKNIILRNVADAADPPKLNKADKPPMKVWEPADLRRFFEGMKDHRLFAAYLLAATTGMHRGEILGLRWKDINFNERYLEIFQTVLTVSYQITYGKPKTLRGQRKVTLDPETIAVLREHQARQRVEGKTYGAAYVDNDPRIRPRKWRTDPPRLLLPNVRPKRPPAWPTENSVARLEAYARNSRPRRRRADQGHFGPPRARDVGLHNGRLYAPW